MKQILKEFFIVLLFFVISLGFIFGIMYLITTYDSILIKFVCIFLIFCAGVVGCMILKH